MIHACVAVCVLQSLQISASSLSGFKKQPRSKPHKRDNKLIFLHNLPTPCCDFYLAACAFLCVAFACTCDVSSPTLHHSPRGCCHLAETSLGGLFHLQNLYMRLTSCSDILSSKGGTHRLTLPRWGICTPTHTHTHMLAFRYLKWETF